MGEVVALASGIYSESRDLELLGIHHCPNFSLDLYVYISNDIECPSVRIFSEITTIFICEN